jgi:septal ring factor EnvC (AmiA/AmiB activator)
MGYRDLENAAFIDAENIGHEIEVRYERQFRNLRLQETRLRRMYREDLARLAEIQAARKEAAEAAAEAEAEKETSVPQKPASAPATGEQTEPSKIGFEFSTTPKPPEKAA